jgi:chemotaxis protein MotB
MRLPLIITLAFITALGAGCVKKSTHKKALAQIKTLEGQLADANTKLDDQDKRIKTLEGDLANINKQLEDVTNLTKEELERLRTEKATTEEELAQLRVQRDAQEARLAKFREIQARFKSLVASGSLEIAFRRGQMTIKLPSGVLFPSGSADLSNDGKNTITQVTEVLISFKDRRFTVAGHTDNVPIKTKKFKNNWYLSTARAVSVVEQMIDAGFPRENLAASGYADTDPVGDNSQETGREQNRRIEIILVPDLSELPQLAEEPE